MKKIPQVLIATRFLLGPFMILLSYRFGEQVRASLVLLMFLGLLTDVFDGIIARKYEVSSEKLRRMDSQTDLFFWLCVGWCAWLLSPKLIIAHRLSIIVIFAMELCTYLFSFAKFGKETCTHAFLSKLWGITLLIAFVSLIGFDHAGVPFYLAVIFGIIGHVDVYLIIFFLPNWTYDVPSSYHAYLIRKGKSFTKSKWLNS